MSLVHNLNTYFKPVVSRVWSLRLWHQPQLGKLVRNANTVAPGPTHWIRHGRGRARGLCFNESYRGPCHTLVLENHCVSYIALIYTLLFWGEHLRKVYSCLAPCFTLPLLFNCSAAPRLYYSAYSGPDIKLNVFSLFLFILSNFSNGLMKFELLLSPVYRWQIRKNLVGKIIQIRTRRDRTWTWAFCLQSLQLWLQFHKPDKNLEHVYDKYNLILKNDFGSAPVLLNVIF